jgi:hypothetical protein
LYQTSSMRNFCRYVWILTVAALLTTAVCCRPQESDRAVPLTTAPDKPLFFAEPDFSFGTVTEHDTVSHTFRFINETREPVALEHVSHVCDCAQVIFAKDPIPPGESGEIEVLLDTAHQAGPQLIAFEVYLKAQESPVSQLRLAGFVKPIMSVDPSAVILTDVASGQTASRTLTISHLGAKLWTVTSVEVDSQNLSVEVPTAGESRKEHEVRVTFNQQSAPAKLPEHVIIHTSLQDNPTVVIPVICSSAPALELHPPDFSFGRMVKGETKTATVLIRSADGTPFRIVSAEASTSLVSIAFDNHADGTQHRLSATFTPPIASGRLVAVVRVVTTRAGAEALVIPMYGSIVENVRTTGPTSSCCARDANSTIQE